MCFEFHFFDLFERSWIFVYSKVVAFNQINHFVVGLPLFL